MVLEDDCENRVARSAFNKATVAPVAKSERAKNDKVFIIFCLELLSTAISAMAGNYIKQALLPLDDVKMTYLTDLMVNLFWVHKGPSDCFVWVANWLKKIFSL